MASTWWRQTLARSTVAVLAALAVAGALPGTAGASTKATGHSTEPAIHHVFVIVVENENIDATFNDPPADPYLAHTLPGMGALLTNYYGIGHNSLDNYLALISGQPPNPATQADCPIDAAMTSPGLTASGIETGTGCAYPADVTTLANQLTAKGLTWKEYAQDMGNIPTREAAACGTPTVGQPDDTEVAVPGDGYASRHDPFNYFASITANSAYCDAHDVALGSTTGAMPATAVPGETGLATDLKSAKTTPNLAFITPNLCNDGHDYPCHDQASGASALADIDTFLQTWVPKITSSPAFAKGGGLLMVTFDESELGYNASAATSCCNETPGPTAAQPGGTGPGGGPVGAVLISPFIKPGTVVSTPYNHYSTLASVEHLFGLPLLGEAATVSSTFGPQIFDRPKG